MPLISFNTLHREQVDSTQDEVFSLSLKGFASGTVLVAKRQKCGRGRNGHSWLSPEGGLYFSFILKDSFFESEKFLQFNHSLAVPALLPLTAGLAMLDLVKFLGSTAKIKWPNDIIIGDRKLCGVLCERKNDLYIIGVGINTQTAPLESAVSLSQLVKNKNELPTNDELLKKFLEYFSERLQRADCVDSVNSSLYGQNCSAFYEKEKVIILNLAPTGALRLKLPSERVKDVFSGEVLPLAYQRVLVK